MVMFIQNESMNLLMMEVSLFPGFFLRFGLFLMLPGLSRWSVGSGLGLGRVQPGKRKADAFLSKINSEERSPLLFDQHHHRHHQLNIPFH
jgi:hypothetical protein